MVVAFFFMESLPVKLNMFFFFLYVYSSYSEEVCFFTSGSVPSQPDSPMLSEQFVYALTISWIRRPNDDEFLLQMDDETTVSLMSLCFVPPSFAYQPFEDCVVKHMLITLLLLWMHLDILLYHC